MRKKSTILMFGLIIILSGWWITRDSSSAQPEEGVIDVWATWGEDPDHLQTLLNRYSELSGIPVKVTTQVRSDDLQASFTTTKAPDMVILSKVDPLESYFEEGLVEPLNEWFEVAEINLEDFFRDPLKQCRSMDGLYLCLPWGGDIDALFWNKDLFKAAGLDPERPPQTMEELVEFAEKLTQRNEEGELRQVGFIPDFPHSQDDLYAHLFGDASNDDTNHVLSAGTPPVLDVQNWQQQFDNLYTPDELGDFVASFTPYMTSSHPIYAGKRMSCQQCHRASPIQNIKTPDVGFYEGRVAMMIDGQWQVLSDTFSQENPKKNYGVEQVPLSSAHPEMADTVVVQGPVVFIPAKAMDKNAAAQLLAWMTSPEILADAAYTHAMLPASQTAAQDARFQNNPDLKLFIEILARSNTKNSLKPDKLGSR